MRTLLLPREVDRLFRWHVGRATRLANKGLLPFIRLPDGQMRFDAEEIDRLLTASTIGGGVPPERFGDMTESENEKFDKVKAAALEAGFPAAEAEQIARELATEIQVGADRTPFVPQESISGGVLCCRLVPLGEILRARRAATAPFNDQFGDVGRARIDPEYDARWQQADPIGRDRAFQLELSRIDYETRRRT